MDERNWAQKLAHGKPILTPPEQKEQLVHRYDSYIRHTYGDLQTRLSDLETALDKAVDVLNEGDVLNLVELDLARTEYAGLAADMETFIDAIIAYNDTVEIRKKTS